MRSLWGAGFVLLISIAGCSVDKKTDRSNQPWRGQNWRGPYLENDAGYLTQTAEVSLFMAKEGSFTINFTDGKSVTGIYVAFFEGLINWEIYSSTHEDFGPGSSYETTYRYGDGQFVINFPSGQLVAELEKDIDTDATADTNPVLPFNGTYLCVNENQADLNIVIAAPDFYMSYQDQEGVIIANGNAQLEDTSFIKLIPLKSTKLDAVPPLRIATGDGSVAVPLFMAGGWLGGDALTFNCTR